VLGGAPGEIVGETRGQIDEALLAFGVELIHKRPP